MAQDISIGDIANTLFSGADILVQLMWGACILVGIALLITAFVQFQIHRNNPKLVPLTTPVTYVILGLLAVSIPFGGKITGFIDSYMDSAQKKKPQPKQDNNNTANNSSYDIDN